MAELVRRRVVCTCCWWFPLTWTAGLDASQVVNYMAGQGTQVVRNAVPVRVEKLADGKVQVWRGWEQCALYGP